MTLCVGSWILTTHLRKNISACTLYSILRSSAVKIQIQNNINIQDEPFNNEIGLASIL